MKHLFKSAALVAASLLFAVNFSSCNKDPQDNTEEANKATKEAIVKQYLNHTVYPTYASLAEKTDALVENLETLKANKTQANVNAATVTFLEARKWWEMSEAFLFGAASDFGIDPHIDSWPLDEDAFNNLMASPNMIAALANDEDGTVAGEQLGNALLGFHGIEFILFREGQPRNVNEITDDMMTYIVAVSRDLRNRCFQLEVSWNANAPQDHKDLMEELEFNTTVNGGDNTYGENMLQAGQAGSTFATFTNALEAIADGCIDIADEVGTSKIGKCHTGEDVTYVESPYSQKSITDFYDNITSIKNAYMGGMESQRDEALSLHTYIKDNNKELDNKAMNAIGNAMTKIQAMKAPFVQFYADASAGEAMEACQELSDVMAEVKAEFGKIDRK
ncbi:MAG: peptidase M75 [Bacteroidales bacterium]|nr:peptidase M75 [Bacteroidales bacterium]